MQSSIAALQKKTVINIIVFKTIVFLTFNFSS